MKPSKITIDVLKEIGVWEHEDGTNNPLSHYKASSVLGMLTDPMRLTGLLPLLDAWRSAVHPGSDFFP